MPSRPPRRLRPALVSTPVLAVVLAAAAAGRVPALELRGEVRGADGARLPDVRVAIYTAEPRAGLGTICPGCHPDCAKFVETDRDGRFSIARLDSTLLFRVLVTATGFQPRMVESVDPAAGDLAVRLAPQPTASARPAAMAWGRVSDVAGFPVAGATVIPVGARGGAPALTDERGSFAAVPGAGGLLVVARNCAARWLTAALAGRETMIRLLQGATIEGRVMRDGRPLPEARLELVEENATLARLLGPRRIETDDEGRFAFPNLMAGDSLRISGLTEALTPAAELAPVEVFTGGDSSTVAIPPFEWAPAPQPAAHRP